MSEPTSWPRIAVVIATRGRSEILSERALPSVAAQTRRPEYLVVVDDSSPDIRPRNGELVASVHLPDCSVTYLDNVRTEGASGSWNTALDFLFSRVEDPERLFVAILDDDDAWACTYLEKCFAAACDQELDMVAADLRRIETVGAAPLMNKSPRSLRADDFLTGNPGIQGSNLFLRLSVLLSAGGFDEDLRSTTDRDLCIRIADLGTVRYGRLPVALVDHFADPGRMRLSTRGSQAKLDGLTAFWRKYAGRMTADQRRAFSGRAAALFDWQPPHAPAEPGAEALRERVEAAEHRVKHRFSLEDVRLLGHGAEAVVFTDERTVYKCIDDWNHRMPRSQLDFLRGQVGNWAEVPGLYALHEVTEDGSWAVLTYDYEASAPYHGGHEEDLIQLLNGCSQAGIVCNNVHPKNLVVTASGVKLIDYGSDIRPWSPLGFEHMARRAFLACKHAAHPNLPSLMRRALTDLELPELAGYSRFRARLDAGGALAAGFGAPAHEPFSLYVGVITSDPPMLRPLLRGLASLRSSHGADCSTDRSIGRLVVVVLDNGSPSAELSDAVEDARQAGLQVAVVSESQQRRDAAAGAFGTALETRAGGQVGIAQARTMLQRYVGTLLGMDQGSFGWLLDDDMRVDDRARVYLPWLPAFRDSGVDVLIGHYEGSSPNPPLNGVRVHLVDLFHNLTWLRGLSPDAVLPDRSAENAALRAKYPDYYYDLSRKHTGHLEMPHWLEPAVQGETVREAYSRLLAGAVGILAGDPLTRPIVASMPSNPLASAKDSVNRGGCTFILNHRALTLTPNTIPRVQGREARRSDMIWAIVNRYYRRMSIKAVGFPIHHAGRVTTAAPSLNVEKVQGEIIGSALYAGLTEFLDDKAHHELDFSSAETEEIRGLAEQHLDRRLRSLEQSFYRIAGLREALRRIAEPGTPGKPGKLDDLLVQLDRWFTPESFARIRAAVRAQRRGDVEDFLALLRHVADDFASATVSTEFIQDQLRSVSSEDDRDDRDDRGDR